MLEKVCADRMLFGSDTPIGEMGDKEKYRQFTDFVENTVKEFYKDKPDEAEKSLNKIFYDNAEDLFINKKWMQAFDKAKKMSMKTIGIVSAGSLIALAIIAKIITGNKSKDIDNRASSVRRA